MKCDDIFFLMYKVIVENFIKLYEINNFICYILMMNNYIYNMLEFLKNCIYSFRRYNVIWELKCILGIEILIFD